MINIKTEYFENRSQWRGWLVDNHNNLDSIWVKYYRVSAQEPSMTWEEAVQEALCFGWIDGRKKTLNNKSYIQLFSKRKAKSTWSRINKVSVENLIVSGQMTEAGLAVIERAKKNGSWTILDSVENLEVPRLLEVEFEKNSNAKDFYNNLSRSNKKILLSWIVLAKRDETKATRIKKIVEMASEGKLPF